jgi:hypothetical protein
LGQKASVWKKQGKISPNFRRLDLDSSIRLTCIELFTAIVWLAANFGDSFDPRIRAQMCTF